MDYEQKYKESLERAKEQLNGAKVFDYDNEQIAHDIRTTVCSIFPELERIRKELIDFVKSRLAWFPDCKRFTDWLEKQENKDSQVILSNISWHAGSEEPEEQCEILCEWESKDAVWHDVAFYHADTKTFWNGGEKIEAVVRWIYVNDLLEKQGEQNPAELGHSGVTKKGDQELSNVVEEAKEAMYGKPAWSEEDEYTLGETIQHLEELIIIDNEKHCGIDVQYYQRDIDWLKSLKDKYTWKPSEEQIGALEHFVRSIGESGFASPYEGNTNLVYSLLSELKRLREE